MEPIGERSTGAASQPTEPPSAWQRVTTGVLSLDLLAGGVLLLANPSAEGLGFDFGGFSIAIGLPLLIAGALFAVDTFLPFGKSRRIVAGLGAASLGFAVAVGLTGAGAVFLGPIAAVGLYFAAYNTAR